MKSLVCILALSFFCVSSCFSSDGLEHKRLRDFKIVKTVVVGHDKGAADFRSIQAAIDSVPAGNDNWIRIHLRHGIYNEKVVIPREKKKIVMHGNDASKVIIQYSDAGVSNSSGPFIVNAQYFVAINITFKNTYTHTTPRVVRYNDIKIAPSIVLTEDKAWFYGCSFISVQDTLADLVGRHYFQNCFIEGTIDFIWGQGQSIYHNCVVYVKAVTYRGAIVPGYITAQGRVSKQDTSGFVFVNCLIKGDGNAFLGRAYRAYSRVVFYNTEMSRIIVPQGWDAWKYKGQEHKFMFAEVNCRGEGANQKGRVGWAKQFSAKDVNSLIQSKTFIDEDGWMAALPYANLLRHT